MDCTYSHPLSLLLVIIPSIASFDVQTFGNQCLERSLWLLFIPLALLYSFLCNGNVFSVFLRLHFRTLPSASPFFLESTFHLDIKQNRLPAFFSTSVHRKVSLFSLNATFAIAKLALVFKLHNIAYNTP